MKTIIALALLFVVAASATIDTRDWHAEFSTYAQVFGKNYAQHEYNTRFSTFKANMLEADMLNVLNPKARFGPTKFSDMTKEEFARTHLTAILNVTLRAEHGTQDISDAQPHEIFASRRAATPNPTNYDWGMAGVITPVYDQGECGSCWAFSASETIESYHALHSGNLAQLSTEQIVDCDTHSYDEGCNGGDPIPAYKYVKKAGGLDSLANYPYTAGGGYSYKCEFPRGSVVTNVNKIYNIKNKEAGLYAHLSSAAGGPISVCVDASQWSNYQGGVLTSCGRNVDHCVQLTGYYNYGQSGAYWNVRNQWGTDWGMNGYIQIEIGKNLCDIGGWGTYVSTTN